MAALQILLWLFSAPPAAATPSDLCISAARQVADESGVPYSVLLAITQAETGRHRGGDLRPWPWTINIEGEGHWFDSEDEAIRFARSALSQNRTSFDTGCFQINYRWHSDNFATLDAMFDPIENARYAARFMTQLYRESGDWSEAAGHYHSRTPDLAERYRSRFDQLRAKVGRDDPGGSFLMADAAETPQEPRLNTFPLLLSRTGETGRLGSLVPIGAGN